MLIDTAPRLSMSIRRRMMLSSNKNRSKKRKRVRFDLPNNSIHTIPKYPKDVSWYSNVDYSFFVLNWKYRPNEPMEPREFLDIILRNKDSPESERAEDFQSFSAGAHLSRYKIRKALLYAQKSIDSQVESLGDIASSMTAKDGVKARKFASLNAKEVSVYQTPPPSSTTSFITEQARDDASYISEYMDSVFTQLSPMELWKSMVNCRPTQEEVV